MEIKNIIFDLGGVVIDLRRDNAVAAFEELGLDDANTLLGEYRQHGLFLDLESGRISAARFFDEIRSIIAEYGATTVPDDVSMERAFSRFLADLPAERLQAIEKMRNAGYRTYVLSNTNPIMFDGWIKRAFEKCGKHMEDYFDGIVCSYREGMCKPDVRLFETVLKRYGLNAQETIMLDDSAENCRSAESLGMHSVVIGDSPTSDLLAALARIMNGGK